MVFVEIGVKIWVGSNSIASALFMTPLFISNLLPEANTIPRAEISKISVMPSTKRNLSPTGKVKSVPNPSIPLSRPVVSPLTSTIVKALRLVSDLIPALWAAVQGPKNSTPGKLISVLSRPGLSIAVPPGPVMFMVDLWGSGLPSFRIKS